MQKECKISAVSVRPVFHCTNEEGAKARGVKIEMAIEMRLQSDRNVRAQPLHGRRFRNEFHKVESLRQGGAVDNQVLIVVRSVQYRGARVLQSLQVRGKAPELLALLKGK